MHRNKQLEIKPVIKFRNGIKRIMRIIKSYKSSAFTDILKKIQEQIQEERKEKEKSKLKKALNAKPQTHEEKVEHMLLTLTQKVTELSLTVKRMEDERRCCTCCSKTPKGFTDAADVPYKRGSLRSDENSHKAGPPHMNRNVITSLMEESKQEDSESEV